MFTQDQIYENKIKYLSLLSELQVDLTSFSKYLDSDRVKYYEKPFSKYSGSSFSGSLCAHSLKLYENLSKVCELFLPGKYTKEEIIKVALLKDIYRAELYEFYNRNVKNELTGQWEVTLDVKEKEIRPIFGDISFSSYMIARKFFDLSNDEVVEAICFSSSTNIDIHNIRKDYKLVTLTTIAELLTNNLGDEICE